MKPKSFYQSSMSIGVFLLVFGIPFTAVGLAIFFAPMTPDELTMTVNGVRQAATQGDVLRFRLIFLLTFGLVGLGTLIAGIVTLVRAARRRRDNQMLKEDGIHIIAEATESIASNVRVNGRLLGYLLCKYTAPDGRTYVFKSDRLRTDPMPYLNEGQVHVYYDREYIDHYFVDVDASVGLGDSLIML